MYAITWVNLKNILPNNQAKRKKTTYCMISFVGHVRNRQVHRFSGLSGQKNRLVVSHDVGGDREWQLRVREAPPGETKTFDSKSAVMIAQLPEYTLSG